MPERKRFFSIDFFPKDDGIDYDSSDDVIDGGDVVDLFLTVYSSDGPRPTQPSLHCHPGQITPPTS